jgi:hypothetical protein
VSYSFPSAIHQGGAALGDIDTLEFRATYIQSVKLSEDFNWLVGADWRVIADKNREQEKVYFLLP